MDESLTNQNRRHNRSNVMLKATLETPGGAVEVLLRNLSQEGALVQGDVLPGPGTRILFRRQGLSVPARVAWAHENCAGLDFDFPLFPREVLRHVPAPERKAPPPISRRPGIAPKPLTPAERRLIEQWGVSGGQLPD